MPATLLKKKRGQSCFPKSLRTLSLQNTSRRLLLYFEKYHPRRFKNISQFRSSRQRCSINTVFLKISQNSQENTCARVSFLIKLQASQPATLLKKRLWHRCFPVNFAKFLRTTFFIEHLWVTASGNIMSYNKNMTNDMIWIILIV